MAQMASGGADTISLRGIARDMGMTPRAIYTYYDTRDDLISALIADEYNGSPACWRPAFRRSRPQAGHSAAVVRIAGGTDTPAGLNVSVTKKCRSPRFGLPAP
jgi:AcrR family transcriptional regulator